MAEGFTLNRAGMRELAQSQELYSVLEAEARKVVARAKASSRVESARSAARHRRAPGKFRESIHTERHRSPSRVTVRVVADCPGAAAIEKRDHTLKRALG